MGWRIATANNHLHNNPHSGTELAPGTTLCRARGVEAPPVSPDAQDGHAEHGNRTPAAGIGEPPPGRATRRRENGRRAAEAGPKEEHRRPERGRKTKASLLVGSLNMNGRGPLTGGDSKWNAINQVLREKKLGILLLQETHLTDEDAANIRDLYGWRIHLLNSPDPDRPSSARGVATILNREVVDTSEVQLTKIVPGRALLVTTRWHAGHKITILNIYAPNDPTENEAFWQRLRRAFTDGNLRKPDMVAGDFNLVEEAIDRLPMRESPGAPLAALKSFLDTLDMHDGWRLSNPNAAAFSFPQRGGTRRSRIDRMYVRGSLLDQALCWEILSTGVRTDHCLVTARMTTASSPYIGKGRWTMPAHLLADQEFLKLVTQIGDSALRRAKSNAQNPHRAKHSNPQTVLSDFKRRVKEAA